MINMWRSGASIINNRTKPITDTIQRCILPLFGTPDKRTSRNTGTQITELRVTGDFSSGCILPSEREKSRRPFQIRK